MQRIDALDSPGNKSSAKAFPLIQMILESDADLLHVRQSSKHLAGLCELDVHDQTRLVTALSEIARNALQYAGPANVRFQIETREFASFIVIEVTDHGPGIKDVDSILSGAYQSQTGLGKGLSGAKRLVDNLEIETGKNGTKVVLRKSIPSRKRIDGQQINAWAAELGQQSPSSAIEELKQQNAQLATMLLEIQLTKDALERSNTMKSQFLANMSHEIRTPMNAIIGLTNILRRKCSDAEQLQLVQLIKDSGLALLSVINDVLDMSKIEAGRFELVREPFRLEDLVRSSVDMLQGQAEPKTITIQMDYQVTKNCVIGDAGRIRQVLTNLIGNAIKFSEGGIVRVRVSGTADGAVRFEIIDHGIGIEPELLSQLFQPFVQLDAANNRKYGGTGLGLNISKRLVELMKGRIGVNSALGEGSTFWFEVPFEEVESASLAQSAEAPAESTSSLEHKVLAATAILLAEDHVINQMVASSELEDLGATVDIVSSGADAIAACNAKDYDVVLMDCQMPVMDGFEATRKLREQGFGKPIIAMTASAMAGDREQCLTAGMNDYISKPFEPEHLKDTILRWLPEKGDAAAVEEVADMQMIKQRYGQRATALVSAFVKDAQDRMREMSLLVAAGKLPELAKEAHIMKGACGFIFAVKLQKLFESLESACKAAEVATVQKTFAEIESATQIVYRQFE
jgi:signal transduction histidine kinase/DNA-binding NarL/FixJ family response regulator